MTRGGLRKNFMQENFRLIFRPAAGGGGGDEYQNLFLQTKSQRDTGDEPEGLGKHLLSKKAFLCFKKVFRRKKGF